MVQMPFVSRIRSTSLVNDTVIASRERSELLLKCGCCLYPTSAEKMRLDLFDLMP